MSVSVPAVAAGTRRTELRVVLLGLAGVRALLALLAIPLAAVLYERHFTWLVVLRPTKEVLLAGGFLVRSGEVALLALVVAAVPLMIGGVWLFYWLGRAWSEELQSDDGLPGWAGKVLPAERVKAMCAVLQERGRVVVFFGRLAVFPSSVLAAAAGASGMKPREFLVADGLGGLLSIAEVVGAGYLLGRAYHDGSRWITVLGVVVLAGLLVALGRWLRRSGQSSGSGT